MSGLHMFRRAANSIASRLPDATRFLTYRYGTYRHVWLPLVELTRRK